jgi:hypothetical protein
MVLKKASQFYHGPLRCFNPLWKNIYQPFWESLQDLPGTYVPERISNDGIDEEDILDHIRSDRQNPMVVTGHAGIGKTTFLSHAISESTCPAAHHAVLWVDVLRIADHQSEQLYPSVEGEIGRQLEEIVTADRQQPHAWRRFLLENWSDAKGRSSVLLHRVRSGAPIDDRELTTELFKLLGEMTFRESARMRLAFIRQKQRLPVIVLDNADRLPIAFQRKLLKLARVLARGSGAGPQGVGPQRARRDDHAVVIAALRPESLAEANARQTVGVLPTGELRPPVMSAVFKRRVSAFFHIWKGRVARGVHPSELRDIAGDLGLPASAMTDDLARGVIEELVDWHTSTTKHDGERLADMIHQLTNYNTRVSLLGLSQYVASGHHEWLELVKAVSEKRSPGSVLSWRKRFKALLLGTRALYSTQESWMINLFSDAPRGEQKAQAALVPDARGALIQLRILTLLDQGDYVSGVAADHVTKLLFRLFGYDVHRTALVWEHLSDCGLIHEVAPSRQALTLGGQVYVRSLVQDFEYVQHVVIDAYVHKDHLVPCNDRNEPAARRFERVLAFTEWLWAVEVAELCAVVEGGATEEYELIYGEYTVSGTLAFMLQRVLPELPGAEQLAQRYGRRVQDLAQRSSYQAMLAETERAAPGAGSTHPVPAARQP